LEDFEREEAVNEVDEPNIEEPIDEEAAPGEEAPEEAVPEEEQPEEEAPEEEQPKDKPDKPIKGPRFFAWLVAVVMMLAALPALLAASINLELTIPAVRGLAAEACKNYDDARDAYQRLYSIDMTAQSALPGLSCGSFIMERQYVVLGRLYGPLKIVNSDGLPPISATLTRIPRRLQKLSDQCDALMEIIMAMQNQPPPAEGQDGAEWLLAALEAVRGADKQAQARRLYYDAITLQFTTGDPAQKEANLARIAALKADPQSEFWMYEDEELYYALRGEDYAAVVTLCDAILKRNRQDSMAMAYKVKALFLADGAEPALAAAKAFEKRDVAYTGMQLAKAEVHYRQGSYEEALKLCSEVQSRADLNTPAFTPEEEQAQSAAMEAVGMTGVVLLLQDKPEDALQLLNNTWALNSMNSASPSLNYIYILLTAYIACGEGESEEAQNFVMMLESNGYPVPQVITDLQEGKTTIQKIFTEGWGGFDV